MNETRKAFRRSAIMRSHAIRRGEFSASGARNTLRLLDALIRFPLLAIAVTFRGGSEQALGCTGKLRGVNALEVASPRGYARKCAGVRASGSAGFWLNSTQVANKAYLDG